MAQQVKQLPVKTDWAPEFNLLHVEKETMDSQKFLSDLHTCTKAFSLSQGQCSYSPCPMTTVWSKLPKCMEIEHRTELKFNGKLDSSSWLTGIWGGTCKTMINPILEFKENLKGAAETCFLSE